MQNNLLSTGQTFYSLLSIRGGVRSTIVTTAANLDHIRPSIRNVRGINVSILPFNHTGVANEAENLNALTRNDDHVRFMVSLEERFREPFHTLLRESKPDAVVTDNLLPWTAEVAADLGIPRLMFHGSGFFPMCAYSRSMKLFHSSTTLPSDNLGNNRFLLPDLPHRIEMSMDQIQNPNLLAEPLRVLFNKAFSSNMENTYGVVTNSFYELEPDYADLYRETMTGGRENSWHIGPLSLCNRNHSEMSTRGGDFSSTNDLCLTWLDAREPRSVVYVCFGSLCNISTKQLREIGLGLVSSGHRFLWVVRNNNGNLGLPVEEVDEDRGMVVRGWAPQLSILKHKAVGAFVMHCGWNSCTEGICAGVPMVTFPLFAEQFFNEKLLVDVLKVGVEVGSKNYPNNEEERILVTGEEISKAVKLVMDGGVEAESRRKRVRELSRLAEKAVAVDGSSYNHVNDLLQNLKDMRDKANYQNL